MYNRVPTIHVEEQIEGLMQVWRNSIANILELRLSCINPSKWSSHQCIYRGTSAADNTMTAKSHILQCFCDVSLHGRLHHYSDVIMRAMVFPITGVSIGKAQTKENIKAPRHWPLWDELPAQRASYAEMFSFVIIVHYVIMPHTLGTYWSVLR